MKRPKIGVIIGLVIFVALLGVPMMAGAHGGDPTKIHSCVNNSNGDVKIVSPDATCLKHWTPVDWNATGPAGPAGPTGATGPQGPQGPAGTLGSFDELASLVCRLNGQAGTVQLSYAAGGAVLRCVTAARFIDNGDGNVTDTQTGLQWEKKTDDVKSVHDKDMTYRWTSSGDLLDMTASTVFLARLNSNCLGTSEDGSTVTAGFAGHCDWRLPTIAELRTIVNCNFSPCIDPIFGPTAASYYWSSTTHTDFPDFAWHVVFNFGDVNAGLKTSGRLVRAVRGGS